MYNMKRRKRRAVFLDRDGTINIDKGHIHDPSELTFVAGAANAIARLNRAGYLTIVATNQSGVARGYFSMEDVNRLHQEMQHQLASFGAHVDAFYVCPHHPEIGLDQYRVDCDCRKGKPGMLRQAAADWNIDLIGSFMVGDRKSDLVAGMGAGCRAFLVTTGFGEEHRAFALHQQIEVCSDLGEAVDRIIDGAELQGGGVGRAARFVGRRLRQHAAFMPQHGILLDGIRRQWPCDGLPHTTEPCAGQVHPLREKGTSPQSCARIGTAVSPLQSRPDPLQMQEHIASYTDKLTSALSMDAMRAIPALALSLREAWRLGKQIFLCGNGGSAGNAIHLANDLIYGAGTKLGVGMRVEALSANAAVLTCLANDLGYDQIYSEQLRVKAQAGDVLVVLSGSGNSPNVVQALQMGNSLRMKTFAILGFSGGKCRELAGHAIHFPVDDMQVAEDLQLIVGHICMQWLRENHAVG